MDRIDYFLGIYSQLPRAGPGSFAATRQAYQMMTDLPEAPCVLDLGCGPGAQTIDLLNLSGGSVVALDFLPLMLQRTQDNALRAGVAERLELVEQDMNTMVFRDNTFDVVWSEGAIYNLGFEHGLRTVKHLVKPGGYVAVSEVVWLKPNPPAPLAKYWGQYPEIDTVENKLAVIEQLGYQPRGHFVLPACDWRDNYYAPMQALLNRRANDWAAIPEANSVIEQARQEIAIFDRYASYFSYAFFVMRRPV